MFVSTAVHASSAAWFTVLKPDGTPFKNTTLYIYNGDIKFDSTGNMYPYGRAAQEQSHHLGTLVTDENGHFGIKVHVYKPHRLLISAGSVYRPIQITKSDGVSPSPSENHIRVVEWEDESGRVKANHIYNWREFSVITTPLGQSALPKTSADRIILKTHYMPKMAPYTHPLQSEEEGALFEPLQKMIYDYNRQDVVHRATIGGSLTLRAYAVSYLGKYGTAESVPYLIDALSDQSVHVGANYKYAGFATTRHRAHLALKELTGSDFGFKWDAPIEDRKLSINKWKEWLNERNIVIDKIYTYLKEKDLSKYSVYRAHLNKEGTKWLSSLGEHPPRIGAPGLTIDRNTHEITLISGR